MKSSSLCFYFLGLLFCLSALAQTDFSTPVDVINGNCSSWNPGYPSSCTTCEAKACAGGKKKCSSAEVICKKSRDCNSWAKSVCQGWQNWCRTNVKNSPTKGKNIAPQFQSYVKSCRQYIYEKKPFVTSLTGSNSALDEDAPASENIPSGTGPVGSKEVGKEGSGGGTGGMCNCEEDCEVPALNVEAATLGQSLRDITAYKELKKALYSQSVEKIINGMKRIEGDFKMEGPESARPSERLLDLACCNKMDKQDGMGCLGDTSYGAGSLSEDTKLGDSWAPDFCSGRTASACERARLVSPSVNNLNVEVISDKVSKHAAELSELMEKLSELHTKLPAGYRYVEVGCSPVSPVNSKLGNGNCRGTYPNPAQITASILAKGETNPDAQAYAQTFNSLVAKHKMLALQPYVLLLTEKFRPTFTGTRITTIDSIKKTAEEIRNSLATLKSPEALREAVGSFGNEVGVKAICSMKRLYSGRVDTEDLNGLDDCTSGENSDEKRSLLSLLLKNPGFLNEFKKNENNISSEEARKLSCGVYCKTEECRAKWKSYEKYTTPLTIGANIAAIPLSAVIPYVTIPYFYATAAIDLGNAYSDLQKADFGPNQLLASYMKDEVSGDEFLVQFGKVEEKISGARLRYIISAIGSTVQIVGASKVYLSFKGPLAQQTKLQKLLREGNEVEIQRYLRQNPALEIEVLDDLGKPITAPYKTTKMDPLYAGEEFGKTGYGSKWKVKYLTPSERADRRLFFHDGKVYDAKGNLYDTGGKSAIFVMGPDGSIYASTENKIGKFHHSSFFAGEEVAGAGHLVVKNGVLKGINRLSGHYKPGKLYFDQVKKQLSKNGVDVNEVHFQDFE